jgi:hypothetical protein
MANKTINKFSPEVRALCGWRARRASSWWTWTASAARSWPLPLHKTKNGKARMVPATDTVVALFDTLNKQAVGGC